MKRITLFSVAALLLLTGTASAALTVEEYVTGEKVTLDDVTGKYWYWNLNDFVNMNYAQQITAIGGISPTYGGIAGGWHMASLPEMQALWTYSGTTIMASFGSASGTTNWPPNSYGRYESRIGANHYVAGYWSSAWQPLQYGTVGDPHGHYATGAWVTTDASRVPVIPAPPAVVLATTGMLCLMGAKLRGRWRRR